jgi:NADH-quinone oxidoreductase subunit D
VIEAQELFINMGPQHPSTHGVLRVCLRVNGETVVEAKPEIGYLHRSVEKMCESRTYAQIIPVTDRLDYVSSMLNNFAYVTAVEKLVGIPVPERSEYIRVIMAELNRIASHYVLLGIAGADTGAVTAFFYAFREREHVLDLFEDVCGARLTYSYFRFGGVSQDLPPDFKEKTETVVAMLGPKFDEYENLLLNNYIYKKRNKGVGVLKAEDALNYSCSGPVLRASGINWDLRKAEPYSVYDRFDFEVPLGTAGDCWDRTWVHLEEMRQSLRIISQALEQIPDGPIQTPGVPRLLQPPPGEIYSHIESSRGELGFHIVSDGSIHPYRLKIRSPAFSNLSVLPLLAEGVQISDLVVIIGSLDPVFGEVDR